uniref:Protein kinase domain-containing protein n=1 Tax=Plectus sambesii TaxID=2011161 RepID=A0A914WT89_9BILA
MNEEYSKNSFNDNEEEEEYMSANEEKEEYMSANEEFSRDNNGYQPLDELLQGLDYIAIGGKFEMDPNKLTIIKAVGKGHFSDVHIGILSLSTKNITVAVKSVKTSQMKKESTNTMESEQSCKHQRKALRNELKIFTHLQSSSAGGHENVLKLLGAITTIRTDFSLLTEYCENGSMDCFLQEKKKNGDFEDELVFEGYVNKQVWKIQRDSKWGEDFRSRRDNGVITTSDLLWFALQIARALQFLATMNVLHRDIAVRNVLLKLDFTVKVSDFGLSRKLRECNDAYFIKNNETALPIRYIAPESLVSGHFAITSELWSFGVVVWELFTFAEKKPYFVEFENDENSTHLHKFLIEHLSSGHRLSIPNIVPQQIKSLFSRLWHSDPKRRPSFQECKKVIGQELMQSCPYGGYQKEDAAEVGTSLDILTTTAELLPDQQIRNETSALAVLARASASLSMCV